MTDVLNGFHPAIDGHNSAATTPAAADSPATPVATVLTDDVKIRIDEQLDHSHADPISVKPLDVASAVPAVGTPVDPASIPIDPPKGTPPPPTGELLPDVAMAEQQQSPKTNGIYNHVDTPMVDALNGGEGTPHTNGYGEDGDVHMGGEGNSAPPTVADSASPSQSSNRRSADEMEDDSLPPPAKRARMDSEPSADFSGDHSSVAPEPPMSATPVPATPITTQHTAGPSNPETYDGPSTIGLAQFKFMQSTVRSLKKLKDAFPFVRPVDPVALNVPHYPSIIKHPMDLSTVERKLTASNPAKPDPNLANPRYLNANQFIADIRLIFTNAETFNGPEHDVTKMGKRVEAVFDKQIKQLPAPEEPRPVAAKIATPTPPPPPQKKTAPQRRPSTSVPPIRRSDDNNGRPKREIHAPPPKDLAYATEPPKRTQRKRKPVRDDGTEEQLRYCSKILTELFNKKHWSVAVAFYEPVDWVKLEIPSYPKLIKRPMDMGTMRKKLDAHEYPNAQKFHDDFKLMIRNCFTFNPPGTPVNQAGIELQRLFDEKWKGLPPLHDVASEGDDEDEVDDENDDERRRQIADMEKQMEIMRANIAKLKEDNVPPPKKEKKRPAKPAPPPVASTSKPPPKAHKPAPAAPTSHKPSKKAKKGVSDDDTLSFDQKKELSEAIGMLDGQKLERVIQIIHDGVPEIRDSTEEIELEIDSLPSSVLTKLYNFVIRPQRSAVASASATGNPKRSRAGKGGGTGGLKRKSMDEDVEAEKIRALEERMRLFEPDNGSASAPAAPQHTGHSSDSSSGSDSSGSDSE